MFRVTNQFFVVMALIFSVAVQSLAGTSLRYANDLEKEFGEDAGDIVKTAGLIAAYALTLEKTWTCAWNNSTRGKPKQSGLKWVRDAWFDPNKDVKLRAVVKRMHEMGVAGRGTLFSITGAVGGLGQGTPLVEVWINPSVIPKRDTDAGMDDLVETFVHEIGHNIGFTHGKTLNYNESYKDYYVEALGICAVNEGKFPGWPTGLSLSGRKWHTR